MITALICTLSAERTAVYWNVEIASS